MNYKGHYHTQRNIDGVEHTTPMKGFVNIYLSCIKLGIYDLLHNKINILSVYPFVLSYFAWVVSTSVSDECDASAHTSFYSNNRVVIPVTVMKNWRFWQTRLIPHHNKSQYCIKPFNILHFNSYWCHCLYLLRKRYVNLAAMRYIS